MRRRAPHLHFFDGAQAVARGGTPKQPATHSERLPILAAVAGTLASAFPVALVGAMAVLIRDEMRFGERELGLLVAAYFLTAAVVSVPMARLIGKAGSRRVYTWGALCLGAAMGSIAIFAQAWWQLVVCMALAGAAHAGVHLAANDVITHGVAPERQGRAFGLKQAAVPGGTLLAGLLLPAVGVAFGWRPAFMAGCLLALTIAMIAPRGLTSAHPPATRFSRVALRRRPWILLAIAAGMASAVGNSLGPFVVEFATITGFSTANAGILLAAGATSGVIARVTFGLVADRVDRGALALMSILLVAGAVGIGLFGFVPNASAKVVGTLISFFGAWGWPGILLLAVSRGGGSHVGHTMGIVAVGPLVGGVLGPPAFGTLVEFYSYSAAWAASIGLVLLAAISVAFAARQLPPAARADRYPTRPVESIARGVLDRFVSKACRIEI